MHDETRSIRIRRMVTLGFVVGMVAAPFLALLFGWGMGLLVMGCALAATVYLTVDALRVAKPELRRRLRLLAAGNGALALVCLIGAANLLT